MPRNGSGVMSSTNTFVSGTSALASEVNGNFSDVNTEITNSLPRDGQAGMNAALSVTAGTVSLPGLYHGTDTDSGLYQIGANNIGLSLGGTKICDFKTTGLDVTGTFEATGVTTFPVAPVFEAGGSFGTGTFSGNATMSGDITFSGTLTLSNAPTLPAGSIATAAIADSAITTAKINDSAVTAAKIADGTLTYAEVPDDWPFKVTLYRDTTSITGSSYTAFPFDDTTPLVTEGYEIMSTTYTAASATNTLLIEIDTNLHLPTSTGTWLTLAVFNDSTCIGAMARRQDFTTHTFTMAVEITPGDTSSHTYSVRAAREDSGTFYVNNETGVARFNGLWGQTMKFTELKGS